ncbi:MAG TPA: ABC transporter ATP-binding protein [Alphaproteobacteria bacterium]|jgi:ATP-binding cassette subfamily B protein|nr:ABC transporter ATP-binding protein [Alphaproteobacteria bacterium]
MRKSPSRDPFRVVFAFCLAQWRRQIGLTAAIVAAMLLATVCESVIPLFAGRLVDALTLKAGAEAVAVRAVLSIVALGLAGQAFRYVAFRTLSSASTRIMQRIVADAFYRVQRFSTDWHASNFAGATVRKITRGMWAYDTLADTILLGFLPALVMLVAVTAILAAHWAIMGLAVAAGAILYVTIAGVLTARYVAPAAQLANEADSRLGAAVADSITCNGLVKSFAGEVREDARLATTTDQWRTRTYRTWLRGTLSGTSQGAAIVMLQAAVLGLAIWLWRRGLATPGDIAYVLATYAVIQGYLRDIALHIRNLQRSVNDMEDVALFARQPLGVADRPGAGLFRPSRGEIAFDRVIFRYSGQSNPLYRDFSLTLRGGERVGLVGASGSGKSTFVKLIQRLYDIDGGEIRIDGQNVADLTQESLRQAISLVPQDPLLFHRSLAENIAYGRPGASRDEIEAAATRAHAHDFIMALPQGYDTLVGERGIKLSGGERQRVALARAVLADARILIFDEATSSLDSISEAQMQRALEDVIEDRTTIIVAHRLSTVQQVDRILVFDQGRIVEQGTHTELLAREDGYYRRLFESQALGLIGETALAAE